MPEVIWKNGVVSACIVGGAGFIGSHFTDALLGSAETERVTLFDNFSSGRTWHFEKHHGDARLRVIRGDAADLRALMDAVRGHDLVIHLASNPDIARAVSEPEIDFYEGTLPQAAVCMASGGQRCLRRIRFLCVRFRLMARASWRARR
jgi:UDP-glucose 4-epimerase